MLDARGTGEPQGVSLMFQLAIQRVLESNVSAVSQSVEYPAGVDQNFTSGAQNVADTIYNGLQDCPDQKYFLLGYSQGASLVQEAFKKLDERSVAAINSVIMVGNPYRIPGRLSNVDSQGRHDNRTVYGLFATMALQSNDSILTYNEDLDRSGKVSDICLEVSTRRICIQSCLTVFLKNDIVCASDPQCDCQLASDHISYGQMKSVQDLIYNLIMSRV
jgi:hypothetical protein